MDPFSPCPHYVRLDDSCAVCVHSLDDEPCPYLVALFLVEGGDPPSHGANDGSDGSGPGGN